MGFRTYKLKEIADYLDGKVIGDEEIEISSINPLEIAYKNQLSFFYNKKFISQLENTKAAAVILTEEFSDKCNTNCIVVKNAHLAYAESTKLFKKWYKYFKSYKFHYHISKNKWKNGNNT